MGISWFTAVDMAYILIGGLLHALIASSTARDVSQLRFYSTVFTCRRC